MTVGHDFNAQGLRAEGEVRLVDVSIASTLELRGAHLSNTDGAALRLDRAEIMSSVYCDNGFSAAGEVVAIGAHVKGSVYLNHAELGRPSPHPPPLPPSRPAGSAPADVPAGGSGEVASPGPAQPARTGDALRLVRTRIDADLGCWAGFVAHGTVDLSRSSVGGELTLLVTELNGYPTAADFTNGRFTVITVSGEPPPGLLDFTKAKADFFKDGAAHWRSGDIILDEFEYRAIDMTRVTVRQREQWLRRAMAASRRKAGGDPDGYLPQPYEQLAEAYRRAGDDHAARRIQLAKNRQRNHVTGWRRQWYSKLWNLLQDGLIGYGYAPLRALTWLIVLFAIGVLLFRYGRQAVPDRGCARPYLHAERLGRVHARPHPAHERAPGTAGVAVVQRARRGSRGEPGGVRLSPHRHRVRGGRARAAAELRLAAAAGQAFST